LRKKTTLKRNKSVRLAQQKSSDFRHVVEKTIHSIISSQRDKQRSLEKAFETMWETAPSLVNNQLSTIKIETQFENYAKSFQASLKQKFDELSKDSEKTSEDSLNYFEAINVEIKQQIEHIIIGEGGST
jgi:hypothetical protein